MEEQLHPEEIQTSNPENNVPGAPSTIIVGQGGPKRNWKKLVIICGLFVLVVGLCGAFWFLGRNSKAKNAASTTQSSSQSQSITSTPTAQDLTLDTTKNYGNKYADGLLPVGDGKYVSDSAKKGYIYVCSQYAQNIKSDQGGAGSRGPWFTNNNTQYDLNKKSHISGNVKWQASFSNTVSGDVRTIVTNGLPTHITGTFPVGKSDPAYAYDKNPNTIKSQSLTYSLSTNPTYGTPQCMGGEAGIMLTGIPIFNGFDAGGRDAGAWEVQDGCDGHPQVSGEYHYHTLSSCITDTSVETVIGFALDGFPITGPKVGDKNILTTDDLDECHGITSTINIDNKKMTMYHYVMTQDFPYSVSCFRAKASNPPNQGQGGQQTNAQQPTGQQTAQQGPPPPRR